MKIHPDTKIGHVHLTVANLDRALGFYRDILGEKWERTHFARPCELFYE